MEPKLNFQVPAEGLEILILLKTVAFIEVKTIQEPQKCLGGWKEVLKLNIVIWRESLSSAILFLEDNQLNFSSPKKFINWEQVKIINTILQKT